jgi:penicillin-binding protein 2
MIPPNDERRTPITPQMAMRVAILGGVAFALFGIVFFRLWFLQVLSGDQYLAQASSNRTRSVVIQAPRGQMTDRSGRMLVENRRAVAVVVTPSRLPQDKAKRHADLVRLSRVLGLSTRPARCWTGPKGRQDRTPRMDLECRIDIAVFQLPYADVTAKSDVSPAVYGYLAERQQQFPGVSTPNVFLRSYPYGSIGAQLFGTVGQVSASQLKSAHFRGVKGGTVVGQTGLEYSYDQYLRGVNGAQRIQVDANGRAKGALRTVSPKAGNDLRLSIDLGLQKAGQQALQTGIQLANRNGNPADAGAFVALDPRNGEVLGMGSSPSYDPNTIPKLTRAQYAAEFQSKAGGSPQIDRALDGLYPVGSTFKVITAAAAMAAGKITPGTVYDDTGAFRLGAQVRHNSGNASYGPVAMRDAFRFSVDTYFYALGAALNVDPLRNPNGGALQTWARQFGFGARAPIDLQTSNTGTVPSPRWRNDRNRLQSECIADLHKSQRDPKYTRRFKGLCAYADGTNRTWSAGDNVSLAVGQGDFLATPLQMAVAYAAIENGGRVVKPHVGMRVTDRNGGIVTSVGGGTVRKLNIPNLPAIQDGLHAAASDQGGTSADVWSGFPSKYQIFGKTGTAQHTGQADQSWYVCYIPDPVRPIVIAVTIERGGFGAQAAAPAARLIASQWLGVKKVVKAGTSHTL